jgi:hypothetical protein
MNFEKSYFEHNRLALALFRATSVADTDAQAVLKRSLAELPDDERKVIEKMSLGMFDAARSAPAGIDAEAFFSAFSARLDDLEGVLSAED